MTNLIENPVYESGIFQLETTTPVLGGPVGFNLGVPTTGFANAQAQQLANRTAWLNEESIKASSLIDGNIDAIVSSLPAIVNGKAYFNTSDNRLYFDANGQRYSSVTPKWFEVTLRATGEVYQFDGSTLSISPNAVAYTDALRDDLIAPTGSEEIGHAGGTVSTALDDKVSKSVNSVVTAQIDMNGGGWGKVYDTDLWIAGSNRINPINNSQGLYVQHRVTGDLGGLVHDAAAAELRLVGASNTGAGQSAFEASLVVPGGVNNMGSINALLANFHTTGTPTGTLTEVALCRLSQIPPLAAGFTIGTVYGLVVDSQIVGAVNYGTYSLGQNVFGPIVPKDINTTPLIARGLVGQVNPLISLQNSGASTLFSVAPNGVVSVGGVLTGATMSVNNNNATGATVAARVRAHPSQTVDIFQCQNSAGTPLAGVNKAGGVYTALNTAPADADIVAGQCMFWFDSTNGASALKIKAKQADGTVKTASIPLA